MEKILLAIDAADPGKNALDFACYLVRLTKSKLTGVFLDNLVSAQTPAQLATSAGADDDEMDTGTATPILFKKNIELFRQACTNRELNYTIHQDHGVPAEEMITESRYADILVTDAATSFRKHIEGPPSAFVQEVLSKAECPVIIAPESFEEITEIVFAYNGSASALFAIKQFTYLFPQLSNKKITVVQVTETGNWEDRQKHKLTEWLKAHYSDIHFEGLKGNSNNALFDYLLKTKNVFLVIGAYGRNELSRFFKPSTADLVIKTITQPIFIAHH